MPKRPCFTSVRSRWSGAVLDFEPGWRNLRLGAMKGVSKVTASISIRLAPGRSDDRRATQSHPHGVRPKHGWRVRDSGSRIAGSHAKTRRVGGTRRPAHQDAAR